MRQIALVVGPRGACLRPVVWLCQPVSGSRRGTGGSVQAQTHSPAGIFGHHIRYVVPLFQRPYVWTEDDQWKPLWDARTVTERLLEAPPATYGSPPVAPHFLGAIVLDQQTIPSGFIAV